MADTKISDLAAVTSLVGTDDFVLARAGDTKRIVASDLATFLGGGAELAYTQITAEVVTTVTAEASATTVVTASAITVDGSTPILIEFYSPYVDPPSSAGNYTLLNLWEATAGNLGRISASQTRDATGDIRSVYVARRLVPAAGSPTYSIRAWVTTGTGTVGAGAGGATNYMPAFIRITTT